MTLQGLLLLVGGKRAALFLGLLVLAVTFGGWNYWRKGVYYTALHDTAVSRLKDARKHDAEQAAALRLITDRLTADKDKTNAELNTIIAGLRATGPTVVVRWRVRDAVACLAQPFAPAGGTAGEAGSELPATNAEFLLREAARADGYTHERNALVDAYAALEERCKK